MRRRCSAAAATSASLALRRKAGPTAPDGISHVVAIDAEKKAVVADFMLAGDFRYAQADGDGGVFVTVGPADHSYLFYHGTGQHAWSQIQHNVVSPRIARLDAEAIAEEIHRRVSAHPESPAVGPVHFDWSESQPPQSLVRYLPLTGACSNPQGLAVDGHHRRLFVACDNYRLAVLDSNSGNVVASLTTGPGDDAPAYDADRELIFVANGGGYGSLTIVQQDANTDSYAVIQNLPTMERARTLAVDSSSGEVYLVTDLHGVDLTKMGGIGTLRFDPVPGSFQVLVIGH